MTTTMEVDNYLNQSSIDDDEIQQIWVEEIIIEEDGNPVSSQWIPNSVVVVNGETSSISPLNNNNKQWDPRDILVLNDDSLTNTSRDSSPIRDDISPMHDDSLINSPSNSLTDEENGILEESFELMEDLMSKKELQWKPNFVQRQDDEKDESILMKAQALLDEMDQLVKEEPYPDWLEEKQDLLLLEEIKEYDSYSSRQTAAVGPTSVPFYPKYPTPFIGQIAPQINSSDLTLLTSASLPSYQAQVPELAARQTVEPLTSQCQTVTEPSAPLTPALIREFESVLQETLTPPHTPPQYLDLVNNQEKECEDNNLQEEELDALIYSHVESLYDEKPKFNSNWVEQSETISQGISLNNSPISGSQSTEDSDSSNHSSSESDPDWAPSPHPVQRTSRSPRNRRAVSSIEERKQRKKEQNKNAATRYRMKKKQEQAGIVGEESVLLQKNSELKEKATELQREVKYLKSLMRDICKAKGLL